MPLEAVWYSRACVQNIWVQTLDNASDFSSLICFSVNTFLCEEMLSLIFVYANTIILGCGFIVLEKRTQAIMWKLLGGGWGGGLVI